MVKKINNKEFNKFMYNEIKSSVKLDNNAEITNLFNWNLRDLKQASTGEKSLTLKELQLLKTKYSLDIDSLYEKYQKNNKTKPRSIFF